MLLCILSGVFLYQILSLFLSKVVLIIIVFNLENILLSLCILTCLYFFNISYNMMMVIFTERGCLADSVHGLYQGWPARLPLGDAMLKAILERAIHIFFIF